MSEDLGALERHSCRSAGGSGRSSTSLSFLYPTNLKMLAFAFERICLSSDKFGDPLVK
jgi:hypothetical protein